MKFIVIEGLDGSGKSTQIKLLQDYLNINDIPFKFLHFPITNSPVYGELIAKFLRGELGSINNVNPYLVALIYAGDRNNAKRMITDWLNQKYLVLVDRYVYSNIAFQCAKINTNEEKMILSEWIKNLEFNYHKIPVPDLSIFLDVPFEFTKNKLTKDRKGNDREYLKGKEDIHEKNLNFQEKVKEVYLSLLKSENNFKKINCSSDDGKILNQQSISEKIIKLLIHYKILNSVN